VKRKRNLVWPQYGIVGEDSKGQVDYAKSLFMKYLPQPRKSTNVSLFQEAEELICITEDEQHKLGSVYETNEESENELMIISMKLSLWNHPDWHFLLSYFER
jgi:hypothetical protein